MATSGSFQSTFVDSTNKILPIVDFSWARSGFSVENTTSTITWTAKTYTYSTDMSYRVDRLGDIKINGVSVLSSGTSIGDNTVTGIFTLSHSLGQTATLTIQPIRQVLITYPGSQGTYDYQQPAQTYVVDAVPQPATITSAPDFNDEENPTITYPSQIGNPAEEIEACIEFAGGLQTVPYRKIFKDGVSYTFNLTDEERKRLREGITSGSSRPIRFTIRTFIDNTYYYSTITKTFSLINYKPILNPVIEDINESTLRVTGDSSKFVRYVSNALYIMNAQGRKGATIDSRRIICGSYSAIDAPSDGAIIEGIDGEYIDFRVGDSRGHSSDPLTLPIDLIPYIFPTNSLTLQPLSLAGTLKLDFSGVCYVGSFGAVDNSLEFELRVLKNGEPIIPVMDSNYNYILDDSGNMQWKTPGYEERDWFIVQNIYPTYGDNSYEASYELTGLDVGDIDGGNPNTFTIQGNVIDEITNSQSKQTSVISKPIFDWGKTDFKFNVPVYFNFPIHLKDTYIPLEGLRDYIVSQGYSGDWYYRQWYSGKVELFGIQEIYDIPCNVALGGWYRTAVQSSPYYPFTIYNPEVTVHYESNGYGALVWATTESTESKPFDYYLIRPTSSSGITGRMIFHVIGDFGGQIA